MNTTDPPFYRVAFSFLVVGVGWGHIVEWVGGGSWLRLATTLTVGAFHYVVASPNLLAACRRAWLRWRSQRLERHAHKPRTF